MFISLGSSKPIVSMIFLHNMSVKLNYDRNVTTISYTEYTETKELLLQGIK